MANSIDLIVNTNGVEVLNKTTDAAENAAKAFGATKRELNELQKQLEDMAAAGQQNTEEFRKAAERAGELKSSLQGLTAEINANAGSAFEGISNNVFLFGERLTNLDLKGAGQALTGMGNAVSRINIKSLKDEVGGLVQGLGNLAGAIISNPLLALGGAVALLVLNFDKINAALNGTAQKVEKLGQANEALERQNLILQGRLSIEKTLNENSFYAIKLQKQIAENNVKAAENELEIKQRLGDIGGIREAENKLIEMRNLLNGVTAQQEMDRQKAVELARSTLYEGYKEQLENDKLQEQIEVQRLITADLIKQKQSELNGLRIQESLQIQQAAEEEKKKFKNFVEVNNEQKRNFVETVNQSDAAKKIQDELNKLITEEADLRKYSAALWNGDLLKTEDKAKEVTAVTTDEFEKQLEANAIKAAKELEFERHLADEKTRVREELALANMSEQDKELYELEKKKEQELQTWEGAEEDKVFIREKYRLLELEVNQKYFDLLTEQEKLNREKQNEANAIAAAKELDLLKQAEQAKAQLRVDAMKTSLSIISDLAGAFAGESEAQQRKAFQIQKGVSIATATIDTYLAAQGAYRSQMAISTPDAPVRAAVAAGIAIAQGLARVAVISKQQFNGGGSTSGGNNGGGNVPNAGGMQAPSPANFAFLQNQPNQQPPLQAYVVSTQVSSNLEAQQLINNQARLGG